MGSRWSRHLAWLLVLACSSQGMALGTELVSVNVDGGLPSADSTLGWISPDGRYVAFFSLAADLVPDYSNQYVQSFVRDRAARLTTQGSLTITGEQPDGDCFDGATSDDGRIFVFDCVSNNLLGIGNDLGGLFNVAVRDAQTGNVSLASIWTDGTQLTGVHSRVSGDGRYVVFDYIPFPPLTFVPVISILIRDMTNGTTTVASVGLGGMPANNGSEIASISQDGRFVAFMSYASNLVPADTNGVTDIFVYDQQTGAVERVSVSTAGAEGNGAASFAEISATGRFVVFQSAADNLVDDDHNGVDDVFIHDRSTGVTSRVSIATGGEEGNAASQYASASADGRFVVFVSEASNLVPDDQNDAADLFVRDRFTETTRRISVSSSGVEADLGVNLNKPLIAADGRTAAFTSSATNLIDGVSNAGFGQVFVRDIDTQTSICGVYPATNCRRTWQPDRSSLRLSRGSAPGSGRLKWKFVGGESTQPGDLGSPGVDTDYAFCLYEQTVNGPVLSMEAKVPATTQCGGRSCWQPLNGGGAVYKNREQLPGGVETLRLSPGADGASRVIITGRGEHLAVPSLPLGLPLIAQLQASNAQCWEATYSIDGVRTFGTGKFRARAD